MNCTLALPILLPLLLGMTAVHAAGASPSDGYAQAVRIGFEIETLKRHFRIAGKARVETRSADIKPRHTGAQSLLTKKQNK